jgi:hypothetical protein
MEDISAQQVPLCDLFQKLSIDFVSWMADDFGERGRKGSRVLFAPQTDGSAAGPLGGLTSILHEKSGRCCSQVGRDLGAKDCRGRYLHKLQLANKMALQSRMVFATTRPWVTEKERRANNPLDGAMVRHPEPTFMGSHSIDSA